MAQSILVSQCPAHFGRRHEGIIPKNSNTPVHGNDVVHIGNEGADEGLFDAVSDGLDDIEGTAKNDGVLDGVDVG